MTAAEVLALLSGFYQDKLSLRHRHTVAARVISDYDFNNTYQYIIAREDMQLGWVREAVEWQGGSVQDIPEPEIPVRGRGRDAEAAVLAEDRDLNQVFIDRWRGRVEGLTHARHKAMLRVILGETLEHRRFFEHALAGRRDLLGRRADGAGTGGGVLATRWIE